MSAPTTKQAPPRLPSTFKPTFDVRYVAQAWYRRVPPMTLFVAVGAAGGLCIGLYRHFF